MFFMDHFAATAFFACVTRIYIDNFFTKHLGLVSKAHSTVKCNIFQKKMQQNEVTSSP